MQPLEYKLVAKAGVRARAEDQARLGKEGWRGWVGSEARHNSRFQAMDLMKKEIAGDGASIRCGGSRGKMSSRHLSCRWDNEMWSN